MGIEFLVTESTVFIVVVVGILNDRQFGTWFLHLIVFVFVDKTGQKCLFDFPNEINGQAHFPK